MKSRMVMVLFVLALSFIAAPVLAAGPYVGADVGAVFLSNSAYSVAGVTGAELKSKTGFGFGLVGGYDFGTWRAEGEFAYRKNNNKEITFTGEATEPLTGDLSSLALMVNAYYDFRMISPTFVPYLGVGVGGARVTAKAIHQDTSTIFDDSSNVFAYQFAAGVGYAVTKQITVDLGYKYFATAEPSYSVVGETVKVDGEYKSHNVFLGLRYSFN